MSQSKIHCNKTHYVTNYPKYKTNLPLKYSDINLDVIQLLTYQDLLEIIEISKEKNEHIENVLIQEVGIITRTMYVKQRGIILATKKLMHEYTIDRCGHANYPKSLNKIPPPIIILSDPISLLEYSKNENNSQKLKMDMVSITNKELIKKALDSGLEILNIDNVKGDLELCEYAFKKSFDYYNQNKYSTNRIIREFVKITSNEIKHIMENYITPSIQESYNNLMYEQQKEFGYRLIDKHPSSFTIKDKINNMIINKIWLNEPYYKYHLTPENYEWSNIFPKNIIPSQTVQFPHVNDTRDKVVFHAGHLHKNLIERYKFHYRDGNIYWEYDGDTEDIINVVLQDLYQVALELSKIYRVNIIKIKNIFTGDIEATHIDDYANNKLEKNNVLFVYCDNKSILGDYVKWL